MGNQPRVVLSSARVLEFELLAETQVQRLVAKPSDRVLLQQFSEIGKVAQTSVGGDLSRTGRDSQGSRFNRGQVDQRIMRDLARLTQTLQKLDPQKAAKMNWLKRFLARYLPTYQPLLNALAEISDNYSTYQSDIELLANQLRAACHEMERDLEQSVQLQERIKAGLQTVLEAKYFADVVMDKLITTRDTFSDETTRHSLDEAVQLVNQRQHHLLELETLSGQWLVELDMTERTDRQVINAVGRALDILPNIFMVALKVQQTLLREHSVGARLTELGKVGGDTLVQTSQALLDHSKQTVLPAFQNGLIGLEELETAHNNLMEALSIDQVNREMQAVELGSRMSDLDKLIGQLDQLQDNSA